MKTGYPVAAAMIALSAAGATQAQEVFLDCGPLYQYRVDLEAETAEEFNRTSRQFVSLCDDWLRYPSVTCSVDVDVQPGAIMIAVRLLRPEGPGGYSYAISRETGDHVLDTPSVDGGRNLQSLGRCEAGDDPRSRALAF